MKKEQTSLQILEKEAKDKQKQIAKFNATADKSLDSIGITDRVNSAIRKFLVHTEDGINSNYDVFIQNFFQQALEDPSSKAGVILSQALIHSDVLAELDKSVNESMAKNVDFMEYRIIKTLFDKQREVFLDDKIRRKAIIASRRAGKCFGKGTKIRMYDGSIKNVEDVKVGDSVLAYDGTASIVTSTTTGTDRMYKVSGNAKSNNMSFICNEPHVLTLLCTYADKSYHKSSPYIKGNIYDIPLNEFIKLPKYEQKRFSLFRASIEYPEVRHFIDPYLLGLWLGDGRNCNVVDVYLRGGYKQELRRLKLLDAKHIPFEYLHDSKENRLKLLAGLTDSNGFRNKRKGGMVEFTNTNKNLVDNVVELCNSLGFKASISSKTPKLYGKPCAKAYTVSIKGKISDIPNLIDRKHGTWQSFTITPLGVDNYFGFTLGGTKRFCLEDYTVVHNTEEACRLLLKVCIDKPGSVAYYINLTFNNAIKQTFDIIVDIAESIGFGIERSSKADGEISFTNGSKIFFRGNANIAERERIQGFKARLVIIDEAQSQKGLNYLAETMIAPLLMDYEDSVLILQGTPPRVAKTYFEKFYNECKSGRDAESKAYHWSMKDNPYIKNVDEEIDKICARKGITRDNTVIQREYLGNIVYDTEAQVYSGYKTYTTIPNEFIPTHVSIGLDYGYSDQNAIIALAYNVNTKQAYVIEQRKFNKAAVGRIIDETREVYNNSINFGKERNGSNFNTDNVELFCDSNEQSITWELVETYKLPAYNCYKYNKQMAISRMAECLRTGQILVEKDSPLTEEFEQTVYKRDDDDNILSEIDDDAFHPDACDALLYATRQYFFNIGEELGGSSTDYKENVELKKEAPKGFPIMPEAKIKVEDNSTGELVDGVIWN